MGLFEIYVFLFCQYQQKECLECFWYLDMKTGTPALAALATGGLLGSRHSSKALTQRATTDSAVAQFAGL